MTAVAFRFAGLLLLAVGCSRKPQSFFPEQAAGCSQPGEVRTFTADTLYKYIDGDAEKYVQAGVKLATF